MDLAELEFWIKESLKYKQIDIEEEPIA